MIFKHGKRLTRFLMTMLSLNLLLAVSATSATSGDCTAVWLSGDSLQNFFKDPDTGNAPNDEALRVGRNFQDFCNRWIGDKNGYALQNARMKTTGSCSVKEYSQCGNAYELRITKAPGSNVYVGTLKYIEKVLQKDAQKPSPGGSESFAVVNEMDVTEFFMYKDGKWRY